MEAELKAVAEDEAKFKEYGLAKVVDLCKKVWARGEVKVLHFYCLNQHKTVFAILKQLGVKIDPLDSDEEKAALAKVAEEVAAKLTKA